MGLHSHYYTGHSPVHMGLHSHYYTGHCPVHMGLHSHYYTGHCPVHIGLHSHYYTGHCPVHMGLHSHYYTGHSPVHIGLHSHFISTLCSTINTQKLQIFFLSPIMFLFLIHPSIASNKGYVSPTYFTFASGRGVLHYEYKQTF
jgi:hypothetical protein